MNLRRDHYHRSGLHDHIKPRELVLFNTLLSRLRLSRPRSVEPRRIYTDFNDVMGGESLLQRLGCSASSIITKTKLLTMDILVLATMKNAAKCDTQCELQNSVNHQNFERILRSEVFLRACLSQWHLPLSHPGFHHPLLGARGR